MAIYEAASSDSLVSGEDDTVVGKEISGSINKDALPVHEPQGVEGPPEEAPLAGVERVAPVGGVLPNVQVAELQHDAGPRPQEADVAGGINKVDVLVPAHNQELDVDLQALFGAF